MSLLIGQRVVRGPDWKWGEQDGGDGHLGTVVEVGTGKSAKVAVVHWDCGQRANYRIGAESAYDLRIFDNAPSGVRHEGVSCDVCNMTDIAGMRWKCTVCFNFDLCTSCYMSDQHDTSHEFLRYTTNRDPGRVQLPARKDSAKCLAQGLLPGAKVERGKDWKWADQDAAGSDKTGVVVGIADFGSKGVRDAVLVKWRENASVACAYRVGHGGKVDVQYKTCGSSGNYYRDHLPNVGDESSGGDGSHLSSGTGFSIGDRVKCEMDEIKLKELQTGRSAWEPQMTDLRGQAGVVQSFSPTGDVWVEYYGQKKKYAYNPAALTKMEPFKVGDSVKIEDDAEKVKACQDGHGGWVDGMRRLLGRVGKVVLIFPDGDLRIKVKGVSVVLNPVCCSLTDGKDVKSSSDSSDSSDGEGGIAGRFLRSLASGGLAGALAAAAAASGGLRESSAKESRYKVGDRVKVIAERDRASQLQEGHGGWNDQMESSLGRTGKVVLIHGSGDVRVKVNGRKWTFNPDCLTPASDTDKEDPPSSESSSDSDASGLLDLLSRNAQELARNPLMSGLLGGGGGLLGGAGGLLGGGGALLGSGGLLGAGRPRPASAFETGDIVTLIRDLPRAKELQSGHGEWVSSMETILGKTGKVVTVLLTGDLRVKVNGRKWTLNPVCCTLATNAEREAMAAAASESSSDSSSEAEVSPDALSALLGRSLGMADEGKRLIHAVMEDKASDVREILSRSKAEMNNKVAGKTALHIAAHRGNMEILQMLLDAGADVNIRDDDEDTAVHYAVFGGKPDAARLLARNGAQLDAVNKRGLTALHIAAGYRDEDATLLDPLLANGCNVNKQDSDGDTPLHCAIEKGYRTVIARLMDHPSTDLSVKNNRGFSVLHQAVLRGDDITVRKILAKAPQIVDEKNESGHTALHMAAMHGHRALAETLVKEGKANVEVLESRGQTPLLLAVSHGHKEVAELLLDSGANIAAQNEDGDTSLHLAIVKHQLLYGTSASTATATRSLGLIRKLLKKGADQTCKNCKGKSATDLATGPHTRALLDQHRQGR